MPTIDFAAVKQQITIHQVLNLIGWEATLIKQGERRGPCPLCSSHSNSRVFQVKGDWWHCYGKCKRGGDQLELYASATSLPLYDATKALCFLFGVPLPIISPFRQPRDR